MNKVVLIGRLTADVETKEFGKGKDKGVLASFTLAIRRDEDNTDFINCTAFGKTAEFLEKYTAKGNRIAVEGRLQNDKYEDKEGNTRYNMKVIVELVEFADGKREEEPKSKYQKR